MCNCNRRHKQVTSAAMAAARANMTQEERAVASASAAIENAGGFVPAAVSESTSETSTEQAKTVTPNTTNTPAKTTTKKS